MDLPREAGCLFQAQYPRFKIDAKVDQAGDFVDARIPESAGLLKAPEKSQSIQPC